MILFSNKSLNILLKIFQIQVYLIKSILQAFESSSNWMIANFSGKFSTLRVGTTIDEEFWKKSLFLAKTDIIGIKSLVGIAGGTFSESLTCSVY